MSGEGRWQTVGKKDHYQRRSVKGKEERAPSGGGIGQSMQALERVRPCCVLVPRLFLPHFSLASLACETTPTLALLCCIFQLVPFSPLVQWGCASPPQLSVGSVNSRSEGRRLHRLNPDLQSHIGGLHGGASQPQKNNTGRALTIV